MNESNSNTDDSESDDDSSSYDDDSDSDDLTFLYDCDETNTNGSRFNLVFCEIYNDIQHGSSDLTLNTHYLTVSRIKDIYNTENIRAFAKNINKFYKNNIMVHLCIRNYEFITTRKNYIKPEIAEKFTLESGHSICIIKTFWLKLIQRTWKRVFEKRQRILRKRMNYASFREREVTGLWPESCRYYPGLHGLMRYLL
jgi:hypothetical protein